MRQVKKARIVFFLIGLILGCANLGGVGYFLISSRDAKIVELEAQKANAAKDGLKGRAHVLTSLIDSYNKTYHTVNAELAKELEKGES